MKIRASVIGVTLAALAGVLAFFNDSMIRQTALFGSYMPVFVYGALCLSVVAVNPLLRMLGEKVAFSRQELALIVAIVLPTGYVGGVLIKHLTYVLAAPHSMIQREPGWQKRKLLLRIPPRMLAGVHPDYRVEHIPDAGKVAASLAEEGGKLSPLRSKLLTALGGTCPTDRETLRTSLNALLRDKSLFSVDDFAKVTLPVQAVRISKVGAYHEEDEWRLNRYRIDAVLGDSVTSLDALETYALHRFSTGVRDGVDPIKMSDVPWYAWTRTLAGFWLPLILTISFVFIGLALVVKRQWVKHEHIPFPIVTFAESLLPGEDRRISSIFKNRAFWIAAGLVMAVHLLNYGAVWWPNHVVAIPRRFDFMSLSNIFPTFSRGGGVGLLRPTIYFTVVAFAFFVASDVALSIGIAPFVYCLVGGYLMMLGVDMNMGGGYNSLQLNNFLKAGSYFGMFLIIVFIGRHYYRSLLRRALFLDSGDEVKTHEIWAARVVIIGFVLFVFQLWLIGIAWYWALFQTAAVCITFIVVSRMVGETGMFIFRPSLLPVILLWGFLGPRVVGSQQMLLLLVISAILDMSAQIGVMPMMLHGLKLSGHRPGRTGILAGVGLALALGIALLVVLYFQYDRGAASFAGGWQKHLASSPFDPVAQIENELQAKGVLGETDTGVFKKFSPSMSQVMVFLVAMGLVLLTEFCRLRIPRWPIHPILFLICGFHNAKMLAASFLLGWLIKVFVTKYGGTSSYKKLKPVMIGIIAGEMLVGLLISVIGAVYYFSTGEPPQHYSVF